MNEGILEDFCELIVDCPHSTAPDEGSGYPLIRTPNVGRGRLILEGVHRVSQKTYNERNFRAIPQDDDLIFAREAPAGNVAVIKNGEKVCLGQRTVLIRPDKNKVDADYLAYYLLSPEQQYGLLGTANGATVAHVNIPVIRNLKICLPDLATQRRISSILSQYDSLIENCRCQIKLLEEAAQRTYREWFVEMQFPGHESVKMEDGLPEGWKRGILADVVYESGKNEKKEKRSNYEYYLPIDCMPKKSLAYVDVNDVELAESSLLSFEENDILFGAMRPYFHKVVVARDKGLTRSTCFVLNSTKDEYWSYVVMLLFDKDSVDYATQISVGTTMPYVRWNDFKNMPIVIPTEGTMEKFDDIIKPIINKNNTLAKQIRFLQQSRDLMLPRLMRGEEKI